jgi:hypothetical protein
MSNQGKEVSSWRHEYGSVIFTKLCMHVDSVLRITPGSREYFSIGEGLELWDLSSIAVIARAVIDTYFVHYYIAVDNIGSDEEEFRYLLWEFHKENRRLTKLRLIGSKNPQIENIEKECEELKRELTSTKKYSTLEKSKQRNIKKGNVPILCTNTELAKRAAVSEKYYKATFRLLSSYVHTHPFAIGQMAVNVAGDEETTNVYCTFLGYCSGFLAKGIKDYINTYPFETPEMPEETTYLIELWSGIVEEIDEFNA